MTERTMLAPVIRRAGEGEKRWFFGGGVFTWKLNSANEDIGLWEVDMVEGKWTPIHTHPVSESMWVLEGQIQYRIHDDEHEIGSRRLRHGARRRTPRLHRQESDGEGARDPADLRMRALLPRGQRAPGGFRVRRGLRPNRAERPGERRNRDRRASTVLVRTHLPPIACALRPCGEAAFRAQTTVPGHSDRDRPHLHGRKWRSVLSCGMTRTRIVST